MIFGHPVRTTYFGGACIKGVLDNERGACSYLANLVPVIPFQAEPQYRNFVRWAKEAPTDKKVTVLISYCF